MKAIWNGKVLAKSDNTVVIEGNHYFPIDSINKKYFVESESHTTCAWKGEASYFNIKADGEENKEAAWYYPEPSEAASVIKDRIAFWKGVEVKE